MLKKDAMRKIIGIGETVYDIIFRGGKPVDAVPGGSVFNGMITLGRVGMDCTFIGEVGADIVGQTILDFMKENHVRTDWVTRYEGHKTAVSLAYLNESSDAQYSFYKDYPNNRFPGNTFPEINPDDIVLFGAYFVLNPVLRPHVRKFLDYAKSKGAILYYDLNFRKNHQHEVELLRETFTDNFRYADIIRGSHEDFEIIFGNCDFEEIYRNHISEHCPRFICTYGKNGVRMADHGQMFSFPSKEITPVSTIGAGDNFNAGIAYGLIREDVRHSNIDAISPEKLEKLAGYGIAFGTEACMSTSNYVSLDFAKKL